MSIHPPSEEASSTIEPCIPQLAAQQTEASASAPTQSARSTRRKALSQKKSFESPDPAEDDIPPPTYGATYGEIRNGKDGLDTSARVTNDGRVNIRVNQLNRRFSQIFVPALRRQAQSAQDDRPPPPPYIPGSLGGRGGVPPPALNVVIQVVGSRGDVQPFVALGRVLKDTYGHRVRLATHPVFRNFVLENGLEFFSIGVDPSRLMAFMVKNPSLMPGVRTLLNGDISQRRKDVAEYIQGCWRSCYEAGDGTNSTTGDDLSAASETDLYSEIEEKPFVADCIIANPPSFAHIHCAEKLGTPLHIMFTMPYSPTQAFPHPLANIQSSNTDPQFTNYLSYVMIEVLSWQGLGDVINRFRAKCLGLDPISQMWAPGMLQRLKVPHTYCWSPALIPKPKDWASHVSVTGFSFLDLASNYVPDPDLQMFLDAGPAPVYIGFGSIVLDDPDAMTELIFEAAKKIGQRVLLSKGWGGIGADSLEIPDNVYMLGNVPYDWLFQHVSCVIHHGGAGTTAAGIAAGRPTLVAPFFGDQTFWGAMVARAGAGPDPIPHKQLTADKLANAIQFCLKPSTLERAKELASKIAAENGSETAAQSIHQHLKVDRLRCTLTPYRAATWQIKRTQVRLSAFAACTLANAELLDFKDLKLFRPQDYNIDQGPVDPISGGTAACYRAFTGMAMGLVEVPSETYKAARIPFQSSRKQSQESMPTIASRSRTSLVRKQSNLPALSDENLSSLDEHKSLGNVQDPAKLSPLSSRTANIASSSTWNGPQDQVGSARHDAQPSRVRGRNRPEPVKNKDMLRQSGAHSSKGFGRLMTSFFSSPADITVGLTKGFHNMPKLWGDQTVRPQEQVRGFKSGTLAAGKEFGYGMYDGVTGLVTQPWKGAQEGGAAGFAKGIGKGLGGFAAKPAAGFSGLLGHTMRGVQKEVEKLFGGNVQSYIAASRVAQGYEEWQQSSETERQDVLSRWKVIQKDLKKKEVLDAHRKKNMEEAAAGRGSRNPADSIHSVGADSPTQASEIFILATDSSSHAEGPPYAAELEATHPPASYTATGDVENDISIDQEIKGSQSQLRCAPQDTTDQYEEEEQLQQALAASGLDARRHTFEALEYKRQVEQALAHSVLDQ